MKRFSPVAPVPTLLLALGVATAPLACGRVDSSPATSDAGPSPTITSDAGDGGPSAAIFNGIWYNCGWVTSQLSYESPANETGMLTLQATGDAIVGTFVDQGQSTGTVHLIASSETSATLDSAAPTDDAFPAPWGFCNGVASPLDDTGPGGALTEGVASPLTLTSATLALNGSALFLDLRAQLDGDATLPACPGVTSPASAILACRSASLYGGGASVPGPAPALATSSFVSGVYDCTDTVSFFVALNHDEGTGTEGAVGTLTLTSSDAGVTAVYGSDGIAAGTMTFAPTSATTAIPVAGQTFDVDCGLAGAEMTASFFAETQVSTGALTTDGTNLSLSFLGDAPSGPCTGQTSSTALQCVRR